MVWVYCSLFNYPHWWALPLKQLCIYTLTHHHFYFHEINSHKWECWAEGDMHFLILLAIARLFSKKTETVYISFSNVCVNSLCPASPPPVDIIGLPVCQSECKVIIQNCTFVCIFRTCRKVWAFFQCVCWPLDLLFCEQPVKSFTCFSVWLPLRAFCVLQLWLLYQCDFFLNSSLGSILTLH